MLLRPTRNWVGRDPAGIVIQEDEVHRKDGVSLAAGAALLHPQESLQSISQV